MSLAHALLPLAVLLSLTSGATTRQGPIHKVPSPPRLIANFGTPVTVTLDSRFVPLEQARCSAFLPPTLVSGHGAAPEDTVIIDFIVGRNGKVEQPLVLEGPDSALHIANVMSGWHYRPALCDGLPVEAEGRVKLGSQSVN